MARHPFLVGDQYFDRLGTYTVLEVTANQIRIRYDDGREATADIDIKARIYTNILGDHRARHPHQSTAYFRTLGFLAHNSDFQAEVPTQSRDSFEEKYHVVTGDRPVLHHHGYFPIATQTNYDKWGPELRIYLPDRPDHEFPPGIHTRAGTASGTVRINNNQYWWQLVLVGFRLGTQHRVDQIRNSVPTRLRRAFDEGRRL